MKQKIDFGWLLPTGTQRMPRAGTAYLRHVRQALRLLHGRFHSAWMPDHLMDGQAAIPEALTTVSYLAGLYPRLHWGTAVVSQSFRNPALLAKMAATLQQMSRGRFILGLGAGWKEDEYRAYGYDFPQPAVRIAQLAETVQICRAMWGPGQAQATYAGEHYRVVNAVCQPKPQPPPPIMIGGGGEKLTLRLVAQHADWWNLPGAPPAKYRRKLAVLADYCQEYGRTPRDIRKTWMGVVSIAPTRREAEERLRAFTIWPGDAPLVGAPDDIRTQLDAYRELGVDLFILSFTDEPDLAGLTLFCDAMLP